MSKEDEMRALYEEWRKSGQTRVAFARERQIPANSFYHWCQRFEGKRPMPGRRSRRQLQPPPAFIEVASEPMAVPEPKAPRLRFDLPDGTSITVF